MRIKQVLVYLGKLLLCSLAFILGAVSGGMAAALLGLQQPPMPEGVDSSLAFLLLLLESPVMAFALALVARGLGGRLLSRAVALSSFTWVAYTLNTAIETLAFTSTTMEGALFTIISFLLPSIFCGTVARPGGTWSGYVLFYSLLAGRFLSAAQDQFPVAALYIGNGAALLHLASTDYPHRGPLSGIAAQPLPNRQIRSYRRDGAAHRHLNL